MVDMNNDFFANEDKQWPGKKNSNNQDALKLLIVDNKQNIHTITELVLEDFIYEGKPVRILNAYSTDEAKTILEEKDDISVVLLNEILRTETAGLDLVNFIRKELKSNNIRIYLRTEQFGIVSGQKVIGDYKTDSSNKKTEITTDRLFSVIRAGLRSYAYTKKLENILYKSEKTLKASNQQLKANEQQLELSLENYKNLYENVPVGLFRS